MKCSNCGSAIPKGNVYCPTCGAEIQLVPDYNNIDFHFQELEYRKISREKEEMKEQQEKAVHKSKTSHRRRRLAIALTACSILFVSLFLSFLFISLLENMNSQDYHFQKAHAEKEYRRGNLRDAGAYISQALALRPEAVDALYLAGVIDYDYGSFPEAEVFFLRVLSHDPSYSSDLYHYLIDIYKARDDTEAINALISICPDPGLLERNTSYMVDTPLIAPAQGTVPHGTVVTLSAEHGTIFYTDDGSDPVEEGNKYTGPILLTSGTNEIKAVSISSEGTFSECVTAVYYCLPGDNENSSGSGDPETQEVSRS